MELHELYTLWINGMSCRGLEVKEECTQLVRAAMEAQNYPIGDWRITEIPHISIDGNYPVALVVCIESASLQRGVQVFFDENLELWGINPDEIGRDEYLTKSFEDAVMNPLASFFGYDKLREKSHELNNIKDDGSDGVHYYDRLLMGENFNEILESLLQDYNMRQFTRIEMDNHDILECNMPFSDPDTAAWYAIALVCKDSSGKHGKIQVFSYEGETL